MLARFGRDLPPFLRARMRLDEAQARIERRLQTRAEDFLRLAKRAIYAHPRSPYRRLLDLAGCELGDLRALVAHEGLEGALARLVDLGVYVTFEELKGRQDIVRGSARFSVSEADFDNPVARAHYALLSSGTRGRSSLVPVDLAHTEEMAGQTLLALHANGLADAEHVIWRTAPLGQMLRYAKIGRTPVAWFYPIHPLPPRARIGVPYLLALGRLAGCPLPGPRFLDLQEPWRLARWLDERRRLGRTLCVTTYASSAVRVAAAARERGIVLDHVCFRTTGEPLTAARQRTIHASGARTLAAYSFVECGTVALGCATPRAPDDLHLFTSSVAVVQRTRPVGAPDVSVQAFLFTSLLPSARKILLNAENGDFGLLERRECGCALGRLGLRDHLSEVRSFEKLTGEGMTFVRNQLGSLLEEVLPARFGGSSADYQLLEQEGADGNIRVQLLVSPSVGPLDEAALRGAFLDGLSRGGELEGYMSSMWQRAGTIEIRRQSPVATRRGKILPFHVAAPVRR